MAVFNRFTATAKPQSSQIPDDDLEMQDIARQHLQAQQQPPSLNNLPPSSASATQMTTMQNGSANPFSGVNTNGEQNFAGGSRQANATPTQQQQLNAAGGNLGKTPTAPPMTAPPPTATNATPPTATLPPIAGKLPGGASLNLGTADQNDWNNLASLRAQQQGDYNATQQQLESDKNKALLQSRAAAGLAGMGLSGAAGAQQSDISRTTDRTNTQTLADLRTQQQQQLLASDNQTHLDQQRKAAVDLLEQEENTDIDGDGMVAGMKVGGKVGDGNPDDFGNITPNTPPGPKANPDPDGSGPQKGPPKDFTSYRQSKTAEMPWDHYDGEDANFIYFTAGADGNGVKKGDKIAAPKH